MSMGRDFKQKTASAKVLRLNYPCHSPATSTRIVIVEEAKGRIIKDKVREEVGARPFDTLQSMVKPAF